MTFRRKRVFARGFTLAEILIASLIVAIVALASLSALTAASRLAVDAKEDMMATEVANRQAELIRASVFYPYLGVEDDDDQSTAGVDEDPISGFIYPDTIVYDKSFPANGPTFTVNYKWYGFGLLNGAPSGTTVTATVFSNSKKYYQAWDEADISFDPSGVSPVTKHRMFLMEGSGAGQVGDVSSESGASFTLDLTLGGMAGAPSGWRVNPANDTYFELDGGKTYRMVITWTTRTGVSRSTTRWGFVPFRSTTVPSSIPRAGETPGAAMRLWNPST